jgi:hypothetical protein
MAFEWWQTKKRDLETNNKVFLKKKYICLSLTMKFSFSVFLQRMELGHLVIKGEDLLDCKKSVEFLVQ